MTGGSSAAGRGRITLLTDFGTADGYAAAMRGAIASVNAAATVDDATHEIPPGDITAAAWTLARYWRVYPAGTVHVVVVDPGVGTARRALALEADGRFVVAPDNGCVTVVLADAATARVHAIEDARLFRQPVSHTFHGRDIFAPVAAHVAAGVPLDTVGRAIDDPIRLPLPRPDRAERAARGTVVHVDRFGNLVTNLPAAWAEEIDVVEVGGTPVGPVRATYGSVEAGRLLALVGSAGVIEVSVRDGSAAAVLGAGRGAAVTAVMK